MRDDLKALYLHPQVRQAQLFAATMGASSFIYAEATYSQTLPDWIKSHVNCFNYLGAVPDIVVPDNLKSGVSQACKYDPQVNAYYQQMAAHYDVAIIPARPYKTKEKSKAEVSVHSEQRSQYTSYEWQSFLDEHGLKSSMSRRSNCYDNPVVESFFQLLKREGIKKRIYSTRQDAKADIYSILLKFFIT